MFWITDRDDDSGRSVNKNWIGQLVGDTFSIVMKGNGVKNDELIEASSSSICHIQSQTTGVDSWGEQNAEYIIASLGQAQVDLTVVVVVAEGNVIAGGRVILEGGIGSLSVEVQAGNQSESVV